jgi:hypothetical protein
MLHPDSRGQAPRSPVLDPVPIPTYLLILSVMARNPPALLRSFGGQAQRPNEALA